MDWIGAFKAFVGWFQHPFKIMFAVFLICACALFLPQTWQKYMGVWDITAAHHAIEWTLFSFCSVLLLLSSVEWIENKRQGRNYIRHRMNRLTDSEKQALAALSRSDDASLIAWPYESRVVHLHKDGILWRSPDGLQNGQFSYGIEDAARKHIPKKLV